MAIKIIVDIKGNMYDLWEVRSLEKAEEFNDLTEQMDYLIYMNRLSIATNFNQVRFPFDTEAERDATLKGIREKLVEYDNVIIL